MCLCYNEYVGVANGPLTPFPITERLGMSEQFVDLSNEAVIVIGKALVVLAFLAILAFVVRLALRHLVFSKQVSSLRTRTIASAAIMLGASLATIGITQMFIIGVIVLAANLFVIACLGAPEMVQKTWRVLDEVTYQMKRLCVMQGRAFTVWKATL